MATTADITVRPSGFYVNGHWVIDVDYGRIDVPDRAEAIFYSALWNTPYHDEGDGSEELWWVELPADLRSYVGLLVRVLGSQWLPCLN
ncbi:MAG: hypothetical protein QOJ97_1948 [Solirubrobacteraceae bacterium]|jgi:hypothetical protein|nr:hypothetical protein [Solirubrobacteraceae bacterium]